MYLFTKIKKKIFIIAKRQRNKWKAHFQTELELRHQPNGDVIYCVMDDFSYECFKHEVNLQQLSPLRWKKQFKYHKPKFLLCESAWEANKGLWTGSFHDKKSKNYAKMLEILEYCKKENIKTVFWNKEDPPNFDFFIDIAVRFDVIYTTEERLVDTYKAKAPQAKVSSMMFASQPLIHNPLDAKKNDLICFAGAYRGKKYPQRAAALEKMIDTILEKEKVIIYDRDYGMPSKDYRFPDRYKSLVNPPLPYEVLSKEYKNFKAMINVNTVTDSQTMCARRIFEIFSSRTPLLTSYSPAVNTIFGNNVYMDGQGEGIRQFFTDSPEDIAKKAHLNFREVLLNHTYSNRWLRILNDVGIKPVNDPKWVQVEVRDMDISIVKSMYKQFKEQTYEFKRFIYLGNDQKMMEDLKSAEIDFGTEIDVNQYQTIFENGFRYGKNYLQDLILNLKLKNDAEILKKSYFVYQRSTQSLFLKEPNLIYKTDLKKTSSDIILHKGNSAKNKISVDPYNVMKVTDEQVTNVKLIKICSQEEAEKIVFI